MPLNQRRTKMEITVKYNNGTEVYLKEKEMGVKTPNEVVENHGKLIPIYHSVLRFLNQNLSEFEKPNSFLREQG